MPPPQEERAQQADAIAPDAANGASAPPTDGQHAPRAVIDITREVCPMTYVRVKLALERLEPGALLEVLLTGDEPLKNVPESARYDGHTVLALEPAGAPGVHRLLLEVRRGA